MFYEAQKKLSNCLKIILQLYLKLNSKQKWKRIQNVNS